MLPRIKPRYANSYSRVFGKPPSRCSGSSTSIRRYLLSAVRWSATTWRFRSSVTARRMNFISNRGSPPKDRIFFPAIGHFDQRLALVVLRDLLARTRRDPEAEHARAGISRGEAHAHGRRLA